MSQITAAILALSLLCAGLARAEDSADMAALRARSLYVAGDAAGALALAQPLAEAGVPRAQLLLGLIYDRGDGVPADPQKALEWIRKAADQGFPQALHNLAYAYEFGEYGLTIDMPKALSLYLQAAEKDFGPSLGNAATILRDGKGVPVDLELAVALYERGVALGDPHSTAEFAYMQAEGIGVTVDFAYARELYEIAAVQGVDWAMRDYADMLERGEGGPIDLDGARDFYQRAVGKGYAMAGLDLAEMAWANPDVFPDRVEALAYCLWAQAQPEAQDNAAYAGRCDAALTEMDPAEVADARVMAQGL